MDFEFKVLPIDGKYHIYINKKLFVVVNDWNEVVFALNSYRNSRKNS